MRPLIRLGTVAALFVGFLTAAPWLQAKARGGPQRGAKQATAGNVSSERRAEEILSLARAAVGGEARLAAVRSLVVEGTDSADLPYGFRLLMPDRFQNTGNRFRHTIDGDSFWMIEDASEYAKVDDSTRKTARAQTVIRFREACLLFLLRLPPAGAVQMRAIGAQRIGGLDGEAIEFSSSDGRVVRMLFAASSHVPLLLAGTALSDRGQTVDRLMFLGGYRDVDGIRFPFALGLQIGQRIQRTTTITAVKVNVPLTGADFKKPR